MINTAIEWATHTLNFWWGCTKVSQACAHCYAERLARLFSRGKATWGPNGARWLRFDGAARELRKIVRQAEQAGVRPRVFVNSMSDTFEANPLLDATRCMMLVLIADHPGVDFLLLTKRTENVQAMVPPAWLTDWPANVWLGTTVEDQETAVARVPELLRIPAAVRFLSCEPLLGPVDLSALVLETCSHCNEPVFCDAFGAGARCGCCSEGPEPIAWSSLDWVICGGESGAGARPMNPAWVRRLRDQCAAAGVPFFFKQWGEWHPARRVDGCISIEVARIKSDRPVPLRSRNIPWHTFPDGQLMGRIGKAAAGRCLDERQHSEFPEVK